MMNSKSADTKNSDTKSFALIQLQPQAVTIWSEIDGQGELRVQVQGELHLMPNRRYERVSIEYTLRDADSRVLVRDENHVDLDFILDGQVAFSHNIYVRPSAGSEQVATVELRARGLLAEVDRPLKLPMPKPQRAR